MRIRDHLYFAPKLRFDQVRLEDPELANQFHDRIVGFYLMPARECAENSHAFASGVLLVSCIDAISRLQYDDTVGDRFAKFARENLESLADRNLSERFYQEFRNGLVHEARIKEGGQFSLDFEDTVRVSDGVVLVNPLLLGGEVETALEKYTRRLRSDPTEIRKLAGALKDDFAKDFEFAGVSKATEQVGPADPRASRSGG